MRRSTDRILTTHAGSLPRPQALIDAYRAGQDAGTLGLTADGETLLHNAVAQIIAEQVSCGVDVINELRELTDPGQVMKEIFGTCKDRVDFASFYASGLDGTAAPRRRPRPLPANVGPIKYTG